MNIQNLTKIGFVGFVLLSGFTAVLAQKPTGEPTLAEVNAQIADVEAQLIQAQADRYRTRHDIAYADSESVDAQLKRSKVEGELIELRRRYEEQVSIHDPEIRAQKSKMSDIFDQNSDLEDLAAAIRREVDLAYDQSGGEAVVQMLNEDLQNTLAQISANTGSIHAIKGDIEARKGELHQKKPEIGDMAARISVLEADLKEMNAEIGSTIDEKAVVRALDRKRSRLAQELHALRNLKTELQEKEPEGDEGDRHPQYRFP